MISPCGENIGDEKACGEDGLTKTVAAYENGYCEGNNGEIGKIEEQVVAEGLTNRAKGKGSHLLFSDYPSHGVIGSNQPPPRANLFYEPNNEKPSTMNFRKQRFDFYEMYEKNLITKNGILKSATSLPGLGYLCRGYDAANIYKVDPNLPIRFKTPDLLRGYGCERQEHPLFRTTSSEYGKFGPTVHDVPREYHGLKNDFTGHLSSTGMPKNRSLNIK